MSKSKAHRRRNNKKNMSKGSKTVKPTEIAKRDRDFDSETEDRKNDSKRPKIDSQLASDNNKKEDERQDDHIVVKPSISETTAPSLLSNDATLLKERSTGATSVTDFANGGTKIDEKADDKATKTPPGLTIPARPSTSTENLFAKILDDSLEEAVGGGSSSPSNQQNKEIEAILGDVPQRLVKYCLENEAGDDVIQNIINSLQAIPGGDESGNLQLLSKVQAVASAFKECSEDGRCGQLKESLEKVPSNFLGSAEVLRDLTTIRAEFLADAGDLKKKNGFDKHDETWKRFSDLVESGRVPEAVDLTEAALKEFLKNDVAIDSKREILKVNLTLLEKKVLSKVKALLESLLVPPAAQGQFSPCTSTPDSLTAGEGGVVDDFSSSDDEVSDSAVDESSLFLANQLVRAILVFFTVEE